MSSKIQDDVATYISHFRSEHEKLLRLEERLHRKLLVVAMLSALAEGRYPSVRGDKAKFVKLIETYSDWPDATSVSVSQLEMQIKIRGGATVSGLSENFVEGLSRRHADWHDRRNRGDIPRLGIDPKPEDILPKSPTQEEKNLVEGTKHSSLLYRYRCKLVHEFREPGHGFEFDQRDASPYYHSMTELDGHSETIELVYPTQWFLDLPLPILTGLETHYIDTGTNPFDSYNFGSPWR